MLTLADRGRTSCATRPQHLVVLVDDEPAVLAALRRLLGRERYEVIATEDPREVLQLVDERSVSLVIADQRMPAMSGTHLLQIVQARSPRTLGVILTARAEPDEITPALQQGSVRRLIRKPWDDDDLRTQIRRLLCRVGRAAEVPPGHRRRKTERRRGRISVRTDCAGKIGAEVLEEIRDSLDRAMIPPGPVALVLQDLPQLKDSIFRLLVGILDKIVQSGLSVVLVEASGTVTALLEVFGASLAIAAYRSEADLPAPRRVLFVGREEGIELARRLAESAGHSCRKVEFPSEAIRHLASAACDIVVIGRVSRDPEGVDLAGRVLGRICEIPVVSLRDYSRGETVPGGPPGAKDLLKVLGSARIQSD
ncbi:MAG TPA: response regulator [Planctomycetota bacterium]|nr:response regulator [Planctomycetota bacterium]